jgi:hypothetical protein
MLSGATYCHWNLHITRCERYKKRISKNVSQIVVKKYVQTNIQEQPIAIVYIGNNKVWFFYLF